MENTPIYMLHDLTNIPNYTLTNGFEFSLLNSEEERLQWAEITSATGEFQDKKQALERFNIEFASDLIEAKKRIIFLKTTNERYAGTACAWFGKWNGETIGRLHWVEIVPEFQGHRLGRPLIAEALSLLKQYHEKAYLKTQPRSLAAIHIYLDFGFKPAIYTAEDEHAWNHVFDLLNKR
ncbi:GNAT family N-acetyltransferase [Virgibacillus natechei]